MKPTRAVPALFLLVTLVAFVWLYSGFSEGHSVPTATFALPPLLALSVGGLIDPRVFWSIGPRRHEVPAAARVVGAIAFALGLAGSAALLVWAPRLVG